MKTKVAPQLSCDALSNFSFSFPLPNIKQHLMHLQYIN